MALISVITPNATQPKRTTFDKVLQGIEVANGVLGTAINGAKLYTDYKANDIADKNLDATIAKSFRKSDEKDPNAVSIGGNYFAPRDDDAFTDLLKANLFKPVEPGKEQELESKGYPVFQYKNLFKVTPNYDYKPPADWDSILKPLQFEALKSDLTNKSLSAKKSEIDIKKAEGPLPLPQSAITSLAEGGGIPKLLGDMVLTVENNSDSFGPVQGRLSGLNPYDTKAQTIKSKAKTTAQIVGKFMEGGVLRAEDVPKYEAMLPNVSDTPEVARNKAALVADMIKQKFEDQKNAFSNSGYDTSAFDKSPLRKFELPEYLQEGAGKSSQPKGPDLKIGEIKAGEDGKAYRYVGGNPNSSESWKEAQ